MQDMMTFDANSESEPPQRRNRPAAGTANFQLVSVFKTMGDIGTAMATGGTKSPKKNYYAPFDSLFAVDGSLYYLARLYYKGQCSSY